MSLKHIQPELQVAVGVIGNAIGQVLISLRDEKLHQGGLWEFPGGKVEVGESIEEALLRELREELDITVLSMSPLITISHRYPNLSVKLHVYRVDDFSGTPKSVESQPIRWVSADDLADYSFPAANQPIITAVLLPPYYAILDDAAPAMLMENLKTILDGGIKLIQARLKNLSSSEIGALLHLAKPLCDNRQAGLLLNSAVMCGESNRFDGIHLTSKDLLACNARPPDKRWVAASCHSLEELQHAQNIGVDFVVLAPVLPTPTHPDAKTLGWDKFAELVAQENLPVYALGGLAQADLALARKCGAQGIAGIRMFLE